MKFYEYHENGEFKQAHELAEGAELPEHFERCTEVAPPEVDPDWHLCRWNGADWIIENIRPPL